MAISKYVTLKMTDVPSKHVWKIKESCYVYTTLRDFFVRHRSLFIRHESAMCGSRKYPPHLLSRGATDILKGGGTQKETNSVVCNTGVFSVVTQRGGTLRDDTKNGCVVDYKSRWVPSGNNIF